MVVPGCRLLSSIYEEANHPLTLDLGIFFFCGGAGGTGGDSLHRRTLLGRYNGTMIIVHLSRTFYLAIGFLKAK